MNEQKNEVAERKSLIRTFGDRYGVEPEKVLSTLKATAFRQSGNKDISNEQMMALMIVANQYDLNPFTKEIFAFPDRGGIVPVVSVDGWSRIINSNPEMDGCEFVYSDETVEYKGHKCHEWIECSIYRKNRSRPITIREYFDEVKRDLDYGSPWDTHPNRMHRHKAFIQCARLAFGFAGIYDQDEAERILESSHVIEVTAPKIQSHNDEQKEYFDALIEKDDALEMYVFLHTIDTGLAASLYNSFPAARDTEDGKGKVFYKKTVDDLKERGDSMFQDYVMSLSEALQEGDTLKIGETVGELSTDAIELLKRHLGDDFEAALQEISAQEAG